MFADRLVFQPLSYRSPALRHRAAGGGLACLLIAAALTACGDKQAAGSAPATTATSTAAASTAPTKPLLPARSVRYVKLVETSEWSGNAWAAIAEFNLLDATGAVVDRKGWTASADSHSTYDDPINAIDGNAASLWHTRWQGDDVPPPPHEFVVKLDAPTRISAFRVLPRQDNTVNGTIAGYRFYTSDDGTNWGQPVAEGDFKASGAVRDEKTVVFALQTENHAPTLALPPPQSTVLGTGVSLAMSANDADGDKLRFSATGLPAGLTLGPSDGIVSGTPITVGTSAVAVTVSDTKNASATVRFDWAVGAPAAAADAKAASGEVRFVKLEQLSEVNGKAWASMAEFNLQDAQGVNLPRDRWTASADSAEVHDNAVNAIDGNPNTLWHSQWDGASPPPPHTFIVDMHGFAKVRGFRMLPRQDKQTNGMMGRFRFYTSVDGVHWSAPAAEGDFSTMGPANSEKTVTLR